jgi:hypothetical protein
VIETQLFLELLMGLLTDPAGLDGAREYGPPGTWSIRRFDAEVIDPVAEIRLFHRPLCVE